MLILKNEKPNCEFAQKFWRFFGLFIGICYKQTITYFMFWESYINCTFNIRTQDVAFTAKLKVATMVANQLSCIHANMLFVKVTRSSRNHDGDFEFQYVDRTHWCYCNFDTLCWQTNPCQSRANFARRNGCTVQPFCKILRTCKLVQVCKLLYQKLANLAKQFQQSCKSLQHRANFASFPTLQAKGFARSCKSCKTLHRANIASSYFLQGHATQPACQGFCLPTCSGIV